MPKQIETIKQLSGSKDCVFAVVAMATRKTLKDVKCALCLRPGGGTYLKEIARYLAIQGYLMGYCFEFGDFEDNGVKEFIKDDKIVVENIFYNAAIVIVKSKNFQGKTHAIYWDGKKVHDPDPNIVFSTLDQYKIIDWYVLTKIED